MKVIDKSGAICVKDKLDDEPVPVERLQYLARSRGIIATCALALGLTTALPVISLEKKMHAGTATEKEQLLGSAETVLSMDSIYFAALFLSRSRKASNLLRRNDVYSDE
jgi:hypothetical protein